MTTDEQEGGNSAAAGERSDASAVPAARREATPVPRTTPTLDDQIETTMRASLAEQDPAKRSALNGQLKALR
jgi:hypothetical protein